MLNLAGLPLGAEPARLHGHVMENLLDAPPSWVPKLHVTRAMLDARCRKRGKTIRYHRCHKEIFALAGEGARWDGLIDRLTLFEVSSLDTSCFEYLNVLYVMIRRMAFVNDWSNRTINTRPSKICMCKPCHTSNVNMTCIREFCGPSLVLVYVPTG